MKKILVLIIAFAVAHVGFAQTQYASAKDSDPAAKAVLDKMRTKLEGYSTITANFTLTIEIPEEPKEVQKGTIQQQGDKYRLEAESQTMVSDGESLWLHLKNSKEVQINDVDEGEEMLSPSSFLKFYETEEFIYVLSNEFPEKGKVVQQIEFKPTDEDSEYHKVRLTVNKKTSEVIRVKAFAKDGSRFTFELNNLTPNKSIPASTFTMTKSECADCHWEDLRI